MLHLILLLLFSAVYSACGVSGTTPEDVSISEVVSGEIVPVQSQHSYKGNFRFTPKSHAIIRLYLEEDSETNQTIKEHRINNITEFPIRFSISLDSGVDFSKLRISAMVISSGKDEAYVGDFVSEEVTPVKHFGLTTVEVFGLEHCDAPYAGGFCSDRKSL